MQHHMPARSRSGRGTAALMALALLLSGCTSDDYMRRDNEPLSAETYEADLDACQSSALSARAAGTGEGFLLGAFIGAAHGAAAGAHSGGADIGAAVGAGIGAVIGFAQGLAWTDGASVHACMMRKGYRRA